MSKPKKCILLGATGSIGESSLRVIRKHPDKLKLFGASAHSQADKLISIAQEFKVANLHLSRSPDALGSPSLETPINFGGNGLEELAAHPEADLVVIAIVGTAALRPTLAALEAGTDVVLANKESLVLGGRIVTETARRTGARIIPADSEHNAVFQCLQGQNEKSLDSIVLTASGGAFRDLPIERLKEVTPEQALQHPNWKMGPKVTIDSATMANKGLELIEAHWLFGLPSDKLEVVIHPPSIVHSVVRFVDGCCFAQMSPPSMTFALQNALLYPERCSGVESSLDFSKAMDLSFAPPNLKRYPCLKLARDALTQGGSAPLAFNASNEIAVDAFRLNRIGFLEISDIIEHTLNKMSHAQPNSLDELLATDSYARRLSSDRVDALGK